MCNSQLKPFGEKTETSEIEKSTEVKKSTTESRTIYHYTCTECGKKYRHDQKGTFPCPNCGGSLIIVKEEKL
jgi:DNA-directed RNA polymerase subunit RPC12/RpoP